MIIKFPGTLLFLVFILVLTSTACGGRQVPSTTEVPTVIPTAEATRSPTAEPTQEEARVQGTIMIWHGWDEYQRPALLRSIDAFQRMYPDVYFDVLYVPSVDLRASFEAAAMDGGGPDLLIGPAEWGPSLYDQGFIADISDLAQTDLLQVLNQGALGVNQYHGALIGLPGHIEGVVLFRNQTIVPEAPATLNDLVYLAKSVTRGEIQGAYLERSFLFSVGHLYGLGGRLMDEDGYPAFNDEKGLAWINLLQSLSEAGPTDYFTDTDLQLFKEGKAGFIIDGTWNRTVLSEAIGIENLAIDPWPIHDLGELAGLVQAENLYLTTRARRNQAEGSQLVAWEFMKFFLTPESQAGLLEVGFIPAIASSTRLPGDADPILEQAMTALENGAPYPVAPEFSLYLDPMDSALRSVFNEGADPASALTAAQDSILEAIQVFQATATPSP